MANISKVYLLNTPLEDDMKNTLYFANTSAQQTYMNNNCLCNLFDDNCTWIIILAIVIVFCCCCNN